MTGPLSLIPLVGIAASLPILYRAYTATGSKTQGFLDSRALADSTLLEYLGGIAELKANGITGRGFTPWTMANARFRKLALELEIKVGDLCRSYISLLDIVFIATVLSAGGPFPLTGLMLPYCFSSFLSAADFTNHCKILASF